jgi:drug/metabolite transporter (DMT)-like permease
VQTTADVQPHRHLDSLALAAGISAPLTWGLTGVFIRWLHGTPTLAIVAGRLLLATAVLLPWVMRRRGRVRDFLNPLAVPMGAYYIFATEAFVRAPVVEVTLVVGSAPVLAVGLEYLRGRRPGSQQVIGACVAVLGLVLFLRPGAGLSAERIAGYLFAFAAAAASAFYAVALRVRAQSGRPVDPLALTVGACAIGAAVSLVLLGGGLKSALSPMGSAKVLADLSLLGILSTALPTLAFGVASARLPAVLTTSLGLMTPLFAAVFAGLLLGEWPASAALPGALVTIAGVVAVLRAPVRPPTATDP